MILVHQMAKVGSRSWVEAITSLLGTPPAHCHYITPACREEITAAVLQARRPRIANLLMPRNMLRAGAAAWAGLETARANGETVRAVCGMREPVARSISLIMFMADFYGDTESSLNPRTVPSAAAAVARLEWLWAQVLAEAEPDNSFDWLLWYFTRGYLSWFTAECETGLGCPLPAQKFQPAAGGQILDGRGTKILLYRMEDMHPAAAGQAALLAQATTFLGAPAHAFPEINTGSTRRSASVAAEIAKQFRLPTAMLERIYAAPAVRHFYADDEIETFIRQWAMT